MGLLGDISGGSTDLRRSSEKVIACEYINSTGLDGRRK